jgi:hypothetical protein
MTQRGEVPTTKIRNQCRFDREEIDQWMKAHATGKGEKDNGKDEKTDTPTESALSACGR